jgi:NRAMP (natural resistance-associated macrophage protein)-like metal ion transporter
MRLPRIKKRRILRFLAVMGPGIITASVDQDAGGITTYSLAGAQFGYGLLWSLFFITIALAIVQEMGSRMGVVTGKGLAELIRERFGIRVTFGVMMVLVLANLANTVSEFAGVAASLEIFGWSRYAAVPLAALLVGWLVVKGTYRFVERIFLGASLFYAVYLVSAFLAGPDWPTVLRQTVRPNFRIERDYLAMLITLVGTTIAPWMQLYFQSRSSIKAFAARNTATSSWMSGSAASSRRRWRSSSSSRAGPPFTLMGCGSRRPSKPRWRSNRSPATTPPSCLPLAC